MRILFLLLSFYSLSVLGQTVAIEPFYNPQNGTDRFFTEKIPTDAEDMYLKEWYFSFLLKSELGELSEVKSCSELDQKLRTGFRARVTSEYSAIVATESICKSWVIMSELKPSNISFLRGGVINEDLPNQSPSKLGFIISEEQLNRSEKVKSWSDMDKIIRFEQISEFQAAYYDESDGYQKVTLLATGDYNSDGIEDLVLIKENSVLSGSYSSVHGYILTKNSPDGRFELLKEW
jgi:hypothetical protein